MRHNIVIPSFELVHNATIIKKFNFFPSFLSTLYLSVIVLYQTAFSYIYIFQKKDEFFSVVIDLIHQKYFIEVVIWVAIWFLLYILIQPIAEWWMAQLIDSYSRRDANKYKVSTWITQWLLHFLPLFEFHNFMWLFRLLSIITFYFLLLRIFWENYALTISIIAFFYLLFSIVVNLLFAYTKFFIIFEKKSVFEALSLSTHMSLSNIWVTWRLYYTLFLVYIRVFLTIIVFIIFPLIFSTIFAYITTQIFFMVWIIVMCIIFIIFLVFISHLNSVLEIFVEALWYNAYIENKKEIEWEE